VISCQHPMPPFVLSMQESVHIFKCRSDSDLLIVMCMLAGPYPDDYLKHAMNAPLMLLDAWFSKVPFTSYHLQVIC